MQARQSVLKLRLLEHRVPQINKNLNYIYLLLDGPYGQHQVRLQRVLNRIQNSLNLEQVHKGAIREHPRPDERIIFAKDGAAVVHLDN